MHPSAAGSALDSWIHSYSAVDIKSRTEVVPGPEAWLGPGEDTESRAASPKVAAERISDLTIQAAILSSSTSDGDVTEGVVDIDEDELGVG